MKEVHSEEFILSDIIRACKHLLGFRVSEAIPIKRGWLNLKWKITTDSGVFLIKQYNKERFKLYVKEELLFTFHQQMKLYEHGFKCPKLVSHANQFLFESEHGELFVIMEFCEGVVIPPGRMNIHQMYNYGQVTGEMHRLLNDVTIDRKSSPEFIPPSREKRLAYWEKEWRKMNNSTNGYLLPIIEAQYIATKVINPEQFNLHNTGWAHRDLWVDNLLFIDNKITAILDFDRLKYDYPQLDVARAILSGAFNERGLDVTLAAAFMNGYNETYSLSGRSLINALRMLWYMESPWWIHADMDQHIGPPVRFSEEMIWLAENQNKLDSILGNI